MVEEDGVVRRNGYRQDSDTIPSLTGGRRGGWKRTSTGDTPAAKKTTTDHDQ